MGDVGERLRFASRVDWRNLKNVWNAVRIGFGLQRQDSLWSAVRERNYAADFSYNWELVTDQVRTLAKNAVADDPMNDFQKVSAHGGYVSTPEDSIGASITAEGRMSTLLGSRSDATHYLPYYPGGEADTPDGSKPREGSYGGIIDDDTATWLWGDTFSHDMMYRDGTGMLDITYTPDTAADAEHTVPISVDETAYVIPGEETLVRDFTIHNDTDTAFTGEFVYWTQANVSDELQNSILWYSHRNKIEANEALHWQDLESDHELRIAGDTIPDRSGAVDIGDDRFTDAEESVVGRYLGGFLGWSLDLAPGESTDIAVAITDDAQEYKLDDPAAVRQEQVTDWWREWQDGVDAEGIPADDTAQYRRAATTLGMLADPQTGMIPAAPDLKPMYHPSWIRDAAFSAVALARAGKSEPAKRYLRDYCAAIQEDDGSFRMCYDGDGGFAGYIEVENDQQPLYAWAVHKVFQATGDEAFLTEAWPTVEQALDYTVDAMVDNDLLAATPDYAEMPSDVRQSLWTNTFAYRALHDGAAMAEQLGKDGTRYREAAERIGDAVADQFFTKEGYSTHLTFSGPSVRHDAPYAAIAWPTGWKDAYGHGDQLLDDLYGSFDEEDVSWVPGNCLLAATLYSEDDDRGDTVLDHVENSRTPSGNLAEHVEDGDNYYASPLGWAQAAYLLAIEEKYRQRERS